MSRRRGGPRLRPGALTELRFQSKLTRALSAQLTLRGRVGGPFEGGHPGIMDFVHEFQNRNGSFEFNEGFLEWRGGDLQLRGGIQKFAWGKLDGLPPTDVLTPRDLHDPIVREIEESKIGIPALQATWFLPDVPALDVTELRATGVYVPFAVPPRLPLLEERWFPPSIEAGVPPLSPRQVDRLGNVIVQELMPGAPAIDFEGGARVPLSLNTGNHRPPLAFAAGGGAFRLSGTVHEMDWSISHYTGPETGPDAQLDARAFCRGACVAPAPRDGYNCHPHVWLRVRAARARHAARR